MLALIVVGVLSCLSLTSSYTLTTKLGDITGVESSVNGTKLYQFLGIPYAKPPSGSRRFVKPEAYGNFSMGSFNATEFGHKCPQMQNGEPVGNEDCLTLNIYKPATNGSKSVMIWVHGGGFQTGSASEVQPHALSALQDVIVVTVNYRLNIFGFITTADRELPGNLGLWDQHLAFNWVLENINDYGGDASSITLFGESAGGRAITFHMLSSQNNNTLFQRVIAESGSAFSLTHINRNPYEVNYQVGKVTDCSLSTSQTFHKCLRTRSMDELLKATVGIARPFPFFPIVDNDFLQHDLGFLLSNFTKHGMTSEVKGMLDNFPSYDLLGGWNNQEGLIYMSALRDVSTKVGNKPDLSTGISNEALTVGLLNFPFYQYGPAHLRNYTVGMIIDFYMNDPSPKVSSNRSRDDQRIEAFMDIAGDAIIKLPLIRTLQMHASSSGSRATYCYKFAHKRSGDGLWYEGPDWLRTGADHTDEIPFVFGFPFLDEDPYNMTYTEKEKDLSQRFMNYWANFAKTGNPGSNFSEFDYMESQQCTMITEDEETTLNYPLKDKVGLWSAVDSNTWLDDVNCYSNNTDTAMVNYGPFRLSTEAAGRLLVTLLVILILVGTVLLIIFTVSLIKFIKSKM